MPALPEYAHFLASCDGIDGAQREALDELLRLHGVAADYIEFSGNIAHIPFSDRVDVLQFQGVALVDEHGLDAAALTRALAAARRRDWQRLLPVASVLSPGWRDTLRLVLPQTQLGLRWQWQIEAEQGGQWQQDFCPADLPEQGTFDPVGADGAALVGACSHANDLGTDAILHARLLRLPPLDNGALAPGYHRLRLQCLEQPALQAETQLIVAPARAFEPDWVQRGERLWGLSMQLYTLRSARNWGIGDFTDLRQLVPLAAQHGAHCLILNPLHALDLRHPEQCSPYSPNDRRRLNALYIDPEQVAEAAVLQPWLAQPQTVATLQRLRAATQVDYAGVARLKLHALALLFDAFCARELTPGSSRAAEFATFVAAGGEALQDFAQREAARLADAGLPAVAADPRFSLYLQWLAEGQLEACQQQARASGMAVGLVRDLAVGGDGGGAEVQGNGTLFCQQASIGAPPDPLAPQGQNWGLPPLHPQQLADSGYAHVIALLRANMAHCGALRIDHVMALMRLWWCPRHPGRGIGAYVHYPVDELFALLRLESQRQRCLVIGEDLGVVPPQVRDYLQRSGVFSNVLFYFEKYDGHQFKRPEHYNPRALAMLANHDVPTLAAWWNGSDLRLRHALGLIPDAAQLQQQSEARRAEKEQVLHWLAAQWLLPPSWQSVLAGGAAALDASAMDMTLAAALLRCAGRSSAQLLSLQLDDLALLETPVNIPGTSTEYPNWQRRLPLELEALLQAETTRTLLAGLQQERGPR